MVRGAAHFGLRCAGGWSARIANLLIALMEE
jgi:hypothetical protein